MFKKLKKDKKGITVVELILYISISSIILLDLSGILVQTVYSQTRVEILTRENQVGRSLVRQLSQAVEEANVINSPYGPNSTSSTLNLIDNNSNTIIYTLNNGVIYKQVNSNAAVAISSSDVYIQTLIFTVESEGGVAPSMSIEMYIQQNANNSTNRSHYETTAAQRKF